MSMSQKLINISFGHNISDCYCMGFQWMGPAAKPYITKLLSLVPDGQMHAPEPHVGSLNGECGWQ